MAMGTATAPTKPGIESIATAELQPLKSSMAGDTSVERKAQGVTF